MTEEAENPVPEILVDGVTDVKVIGQVVRIPFFTKLDGQVAITARIALPLSDLPAVIAAFVSALTDAMRRRRKTKN